MQFYETTTKWIIFSQKSDATTNLEEDELETYNEVDKNKVNNLKMKTITIITIPRKLMTTIM